MAKCATRRPAGWQAFLLHGVETSDWPEGVLVPSTGHLRAGQDTFDLSVFALALLHPCGTRPSSLRIPDALKVSCQPPVEGFHLCAGSSAACPESPTGGLGRLHPAWRFGGGGLSVSLL